VKQQINFIFGTVYYHEVWNKQGFSDLNHLSRVQQKHSKSQTRVHCYPQLKLFGEQQRVDLHHDAKR